MKRKLPIYPIIAGLVWALCLGYIVLGPTLLDASPSITLEQAQAAVLESQEKLAFAQSAGKEDTKQRLNERLADTIASLNTFSCPVQAESQLIFQIGQLAHALDLKNFTSRFPGNAPENILDKSDRMAEGWLTVEFDADYLKTVAFANSLERHEPVLFVESIHLRRRPDNEHEASVRMMLSYLIRTTETQKDVAQAGAAQ